MTTSHPPHPITQAADRLGWTITAIQTHPSGTVYLCRLPDGITEPFTENAILTQLSLMERFTATCLQIAGLPRPTAARVAAQARLNCLSRPDALTHSRRPCSPCVGHTPESARTGEAIPPLVTGQNTRCKCLAARPLPRPPGAGAP